MQLATKLSKATKEKTHKLSVWFIRDVAFVGFAFLIIINDVANRNSMAAICLVLVNSSILGRDQFAVNNLINEICRLLKLIMQRLIILPVCRPIDAVVGDNHNIVASTKVKKCIRLDAG